MITLKEIKGLRVFEADSLGNLIELSKETKFTEKQIQELLSDEKFTLGPNTWLFNGIKRAHEFSIKRLKLRIDWMENFNKEG